MPGPTETNFFRRARMADTVIGRMPKDASERVAKQGYDAMMRGDRKVLAASLFSRAMDHQLVCSRWGEGGGEPVDRRSYRKPLKGHLDGGTGGSR
jgi:hypothetical protein